MPQNSYVVIFHRNEVRLREPEFSQLERWVEAWLAAKPQPSVVIGCSPDTAREARIRRLMHLRHALGRCEVPRARIRLARESLGPAPQAVVGDRPLDVFWLSLVESSA